MDGTVITRVTSIETDVLKSFKLWRTAWEIWHFLNEESSSSSSCSVNVILGALGIMLFHSVTFILVFYSRCLIVSTIAVRVFAYCRLLKSS